MRRLFLITLVAFLICIACPSLSLSAQKRSGNYVNVSQNEIIEGDLYIFGETVAVNGTVTGDLICFCRNLSVSGTVSGDIIAFCQRLELNGMTDDDMRAFAEDIIVAGAIKKNATTFCKSLIFTDEASIGEDLSFGCATSELRGIILGNVRGEAAFINLSGTVEKDTRFSAEKITLTQSAKIGGDLHVTGREISIDPGAQITGETEREAFKKKPSKWTKPSFYLFRIIWLVGAILVGFLMIKLFPGLTGKIVGEAQSLWKTVGIGIIALLFTPVAIIILAITIIGLPLSFVSLALYLAFFYLSTIFTGMVVGAITLRSSQRPFQISLLAMITGIAILHVLFLVPLLGFIVHLIAWILGMGMIASGGWRFIREAA